MLLGHHHLPENVVIYYISILCKQNNGKVRLSLELLRPTWIIPTKKKSLIEKLVKTRYLNHILPTIYIYIYVTT